MLSDDSTSSDYRPRHSPRTAKPVRRHKRFPSAFSSESALSTLPEYTSLEAPHNQPFTPLKEEISAWDGDEMPPPPGYPGSLSSTGDDDDEEEVDADEEGDVVPLPTFRTRTLRRRRSISGGGRVVGNESKLDSLLERSILALETSNALLHSTLITQHSLSNVLADSSFDRSMDAQIRFLSRRFASDEEREMELDRVLDGVTGLVSGLGLSSIDEEGVARSLPAENHMARLARLSIPSTIHTSEQPISSSRSHLTGNSGNSGRLRLSTHGKRPRSPPPRPFTQYVSIESEGGLAAETTATEQAIYLPSTSGIRTSPVTATFSAPTPLAISPSQQRQYATPPQTPRSPLAQTMLQRIASNTSSGSTSPEAIRSLLSRLPKPPNKLFSSQAAAITITPPTSIRSAPITRATSEASSGPGSVASTPSGTIRVGRPTRRPYAASVGGSGAASSSSGSAQILEEDEKRTATPTSEVAAGKQRAEGERPGMEGARSRRSRSASVSGHLRPSALGAISSPSASQPIVYRGDKSSTDRILALPQPFLHGTGLEPPRSASPLVTGFTPTHTPRSSMSGTSTPRRSALKTSSGASTPMSSGHPSPRTVSFSPLPPKHETDGTFSRAKDKNKLKGKGKEKKEEEKKGWWTEWLLGAPPPGSVDPYTSPVHSRSMVREEGRWAGGDPWGT